MKKLIFAVSLFLCVNIFAQQPIKKSLTIADFGDWNTISGTAISNNGECVVFELNPQKGDGNLIIVNEAGSDTISRGYRAKIGSENDFVAFYIKQPEQKIRKAKLDKVKKDKMPKDSLGIFVFEENELFKFPKLKSFKTADENATWIAFMLESPKAKKDTSETDKAEGEELEKSKKLPKQPGDDLVLFSLKSKDTLQFKHVTEYIVSKKGASVFFVQQTKDTINTYSTLKWFDTETGSVDELFTSQGWIEKVAANEQGDKCAYLFSKDTIDEKVYALYEGDVLSDLEIIADTATSGMPTGWSPSKNGTISFSENSSKLYFATAKMPVPEPKDSLLDEETPKVDVWNWKDLKLQPQQKIEAEKEKKRTYLAVFHFDNRSLVQLADEKIKSVSRSKKGNLNIGLGFDGAPYQRASSWTGKWSRDYYVVDFMTGEKREIVHEKSSARLSPKGQFVVWYDESDSSYYAKPTGVNHTETVALTKAIPANFYEELHDSPSDPRPYGIAGFSEDDRFVYIYDRYDIWRVDAQGDTDPECLTNGFGRKHRVRLRYEKLDKELDFIPSDKTILLSAIDEITMERGYFNTSLDGVKDPRLLVMDKFIFGGLQKAKNADEVLWTKQNVGTFPDLWRSTVSFQTAERISVANARQDEFVWAKVELVEWTSFTGERLKGLLYTPENLDSNKKYPMIVYFYERNSELLYRHQHPYPSHSTINKTFYASNGYVVFVPDITYKIGYPGQSAYDAIVSGTQYLTNRFSFIDRDKIGLQGQSWGGYQTAWLITQTDLYAAAMAGAPVSNMTSAYGGIRWGTGMSRMFQYEHTQSRIGGTLWDKPLLYIENSPLFYAPKVNTPLLMMHNDKDTAVPWYQGIEYFVALRRLNKPVWMLTYNGEPHNLPKKSWANRVDLSTRMFQFFNHYLKGAPMPEWMEKGIPAIDKGKNLGY